MQWRRLQHNLIDLWVQCVDLGFLIFSWPNSFSGFKCSVKPAWKRTRTTNRSIKTHSKCLLGENYLARWQRIIKCLPIKHPDGFDKWVNAANFKVGPLQTLQWVWMWTVWKKRLKIFDKRKESLLLTKYKISSFWQGTIHLFRHNSV